MTTALPTSLGALRGLFTQAGAPTALPAATTVPSDFRPTVL